MILSLDRANLSFIPGFRDEAGNARLILYFIAKKAGLCGKTGPVLLDVWLYSLLEIVFNQRRSHVRTGKSGGMVGINYFTVLASAAGCTLRCASRTGERTRGFFDCPSPRCVAKYY